MNIQEYRESKLKTKVTADIAERWQKRVVVRGLDKQGRAGGLAYLESYGKRIGAKKCVRLAVQAESVGALEFAEIIWEKAYNLETGSIGSLTVDESAVSIIDIPTPETLPTIEGLPAHLQPGKIATLQPQDLIEDLEFYLASEEYWAQPKIDGYRLLAICTIDQIWYQKRSLKLDSTPSLEIEAALRQLASQLGTLIIDGELTWLDAHMDEHRTSAQAATANINMQHPEATPIAYYMIFDCLYMNGSDLTLLSFKDRYVCIHTLESLLWNQVRCTGTYQLEDSKRGLVQRQKEEGHEGVVFRKINEPYTAGKSKTAFRHKFLTEHVLTVTELTTTTADGRLFGAMGTELGLVGTGFSDADQVQLYELFFAGNLVIEVVSQGLTENGKLWHPRYVKVAE